MDKEVVIETKIEDGSYAPQKAHEWDAGYDIRSPHNCIVPPGQHTIIDTGVHMLIPPGYTGFLKSKSGLNIKNGITGEGVIDAGYTGSIVVKLSNDSYVTKCFDKGDKLIQIVILPIPKTRIKIVDSIDAVTERGDNGFGSSGR